LPAISRLAGVQAYPVRPVTVIEPFGVSSVLDITIRGRRRDCQSYWGNR